MQSLAPYTTMSTLKHDFKGNASELKGQLDGDKKKDLRTNHFSIGGPSANVHRTVQSLSFRPMTAQAHTEAKPIVNEHQIQLNKQQHWGAPPNAGQPKCKRPMSAHAGGGFVTSNMINFQWYQPTAFR